MNKIIIFTEKELTHIKRLFTEMLEQELYSSEHSNIQALLQEFKNINFHETINKLCMTVLDSYYCIYILKGFELSELRELSWLSEDDISIYVKIYDIEEDSE